MGAWLLSICHTSGLLYLRNRSKLEENPLSEGEAVPDQRPIRSEWDHYSDSLRITVGLLSPEYRDAIQLRYYSGLSYREIPAACGITEEHNADLAESVKQHCFVFEDVVLLDDAAAAKLANDVDEDTLMQAARDSAAVILW